MRVFLVRVDHFVEAHGEASFNGSTIKAFDSAEKAEAFRKNTPSDGWADVGDVVEVEVE